MKEQTRIEAIKTILLPAACMLLVCLLAFWLGWKFAARAARDASNASEAALLGAVQAHDPALANEALLRAVSQPDASAVAAGRTLLREYGYTDNFFAVPALEHALRQMRMVGAVALAALAVLLTGYFCLYRRQKIKRTLSLLTYVQRVQDGDYALAPDDNAADVLSLLKNELYKITVLLRESAENSRRDSENLSRALTDISHQIKTPLTSIRIMLDNVMDEPEMPAPVRQDFLHSVSEQLEQISSLVVTLLHLAQFDSGVITMHPATFPVRTLVDAALARVAVLAEVRGVTLSCSGDLDVPLTADCKWQTEALVNVLKNCVEHTPAGGAVSVYAERSALFLRLFIRDNGEGMPRSALRHIFDRFYKPPGSTSDGIGVGLAFTKAIVEQENAFITVDSAPQCGTTFVIRYPNQG